MTKPRLFPEPPESDKRKPEDRLKDLATKVLSVPKSEIDKREKQWRNKIKT
jgi:hypothetical protein